MFQLLRPSVAKDAGPPRKLSLEAFTPLQIGDTIVSQAPVRARSELWRVLRRSYAPAPQYSWLLSTDISDCVRAAIRKDVPRSFPEYTFFEGAMHQADLENILAAYAACDPEVGYCQGLNFLAGCVQLYAPEPEAAFATLHVLLVPLGMRALFLPDFAAAQENMALVYAHIPTDLRAHLENLGVAPSMFLPPWLLTVFAADFPLSFAARLVDIMLADGWQRILINTAASLLTVAKDALMAARHMEAALNVLKIAPRTGRGLVQDQMPALPVSQLHEILGIARTLPWSAPERTSGASTSDLCNCFSNTSSEARRRTRPASLCLPPRAPLHPSRASLASAGSRSAEGSAHGGARRRTGDAPSLAELGGRLASLQLERSRQGASSASDCTKSAADPVDARAGEDLDSCQSACSPRIAAHGGCGAQHERSPFVQAP